MDIEKIIFLAVAIGLSIFSMYRKAKKQKQSSNEYEESDHNFPHEEIPYEMPDPVIVFKQQNASDLLQKSNISTKKSKKQHSLQNMETSKFSKENIENFTQNTDSENEITLLEDFNGTELQKAFLYSEIFKNTKS